MRNSGRTPKLKTLPDGRMVYTHAWYPENGPTEDGVSYSQEITWGPVRHYVHSRRYTGVDKDSSE